MSRVLSVVVSLTLLFVLFSRTDFQAFLYSYKGLSFGVVLFAFFLNIIGAVFFNSAQIYCHVILLSKIQKSVSNFLYLLKLDFIIRYYSLFFPAAITAVVRWKYQKELGIDAYDSMSLVLVNKILNILFIFVFSAIGLYFVSQENFKILSLVCLIFSFLSFLFLALFVRGSLLKLLKILFELRITSRFVNSQKSTGIINKIANRQYIGIGNIWLYIFPVISFVLVGLSQYIVLYEFGVYLTVWDAFFLRGVVLLAMMMPFSIGGIGLRELGVVGVLALYNVQEEKGLAISIVLFGFQLLICLIGFFLSVVKGIDKREE